MLIYYNYFGTKIIICFNICDFIVFEQFKMIFYIFFILKLLWIVNLKYSYIKLSKNLLLILFSIFCSNCKQDHFMMHHLQVYKDLEEIIRFLSSLMMQIYKKDWKTIKIREKSSRGRILMVIKESRPRKN